MRKPKIPNINDFMKPVDSFKWTDDKVIEFINLIKEYENQPPLSKTEKELHLNGYKMLSIIQDHVKLAKKIVKDGKDK